MPDSAFHQTYISKRDFFFGAQVQSDKSENRQQMNAEEDPAPLAMNAILASAGAGGRRRVGDGRCAGLERA